MNTTSTTTSSIQQFGKLWPQCVARAWQDDTFREALKKDPVSTLRDSYQFALPQGLKLEIVEGEELQRSAQADTLRMVIPPAPAVDMREVARADADTGLMDAQPFTHLSFSC